MKTRTIFVLVFIWFLIFLLMNIQADCQVYSSWASMQIRHAVETEKPKVSYDTVQVGDMPPFRMELRNSFVYKDFKIDIVRDYYNGKMRMAVYTGTSIFILRPEDEYIILEKLITQIK